MRLKSLHLNQFGLFRDQEMELAPLTILFGANGAGKSTILDAIEDALIPSANRKIVGGVGGPNNRSAVVYATLDEWDTPGSSDENIMRRVLCLDLGYIEPADAVEQGFLDLDEVSPPLASLLLEKSSKMVESGRIGTPENRIQIALHLFEHSVLAFGGLQGGSEANWGLVCRTPLDESAIPADAFDYLGDYDFDGDLLSDEILTAIYDLTDGRDAIVIEVNDEPDGTLANQKSELKATRTDLSNAIRPLPMRLDFEPATLDLELESFIDQIASRLSFNDPLRYEVPWLVTDSSTGDRDSPAAEHSVKSIDHVFNESSNVSDTLGVSRDETNDHHEVQTFALSSLIRNAVERIATHANSIAPRFLLLDSRIDIEIISPAEWKPNVPRIRATMNEGGKKFPLAYVGSGIARWASYSIRLACQELLVGAIIGDPNPDVSVTLDEIRYVGDTAILEFPERISYDGATPYEVIAALEILPDKLEVVLLLDEPEAHLHPRAVASIGEWLLDIAPRVASVVVATHHPALFNLRGIGVQKHVILRSQGTSVVEPWNPASEELVDQLAHQIGLTAGDLFMMSRFVLFVEGPHDIVIIEEFFGDLLRESMVRLVPLHGAHDIGQLATSEIVWCMGIPIGVLTDGTNIERVMRGERANYIEKLVDRMLRECKAENREIAPFGLEKDDILLYLDDEITATFASEMFPGWSKAKAIWHQIDQPANDTANGAKFKKWITKTYGLPLDRDKVRDIAKKCKEAGNISEELYAIVSGIVAKTI